jgi:hypothetical protein
MEKTNAIYEVQKALLGQQTYWTHRPRLKVRNVNLAKPLSTAEPAEICFEVINAGSGDAIIEMGPVGVAVSEAPPWRQYSKLPIVDDGELHFIDNWMKRNGGKPILKPGISEIVVKTTKFALPPIQVDAINTRGANRPKTFIFVVGYLWYADRDGVHYRTGFCRRYPNDLHRFEAISDADLEYED